MQNIKRSIYLIKILLITAISLQAAQIIGSLAEGKEKKISKGMDIMEGILEKKIDTVMSDYLHLKVDALYIDGYGMIFNITNSDPFSTIRLKLDRIIENIPEIPRIVQIDDENGRVKVQVEMRSDEDVKENINNEKSNVEEEKVIIKNIKKKLVDMDEKPRQIWVDEHFVTEDEAKNSEELLISIHNLENTLKRFIVDYLSSLRDLSDNDKITFYITLPEFDFNTATVFPKSIRADINYKDLRSYRIEKINESQLLKKIDIQRKMEKSKIQKEIDIFSDIMAEIFEDSPLPGLGSHINNLFVDNLGVIIILDSPFDFRMPDLPDFNFNFEFQSESGSKSYSRSRSRSSSSSRESERLKAKEEQKKQNDKLVQEVLTEAGSYVNTLKSVGNSEDLIFIMDGAGHHSEQNLTIRIKKKYLLDYYREKIDIKRLIKYATVQIALSNGVSP